MNKGKLLDILLERTTLDEIDHMLFDLDVPTGEFTGPQSKKIRSLILYLEKRNRLNEIPDWIKENRTDIDLTAVLSAPDDGPMEPILTDVPAQGGGSGQNSTVWIAAITTILAAVVTGLLAIFSDDIRCLVVECGVEPEPTPVVVAPTDEPIIIVVDESATDTPVPTATATPDLVATAEFEASQGSTATAEAELNAIATQEEATKQAILEVNKREVALDKLINQEIESGNARDLAGLLDLMSPTIEIVSRNGTPGDVSDDLFFNGYEGASEFYTNFFALDWEAYSLENVEATVEGDEAIITHDGTISDGTLFPDRVTYKLRYANDEWLITNIEVGTLP